MKILFIDTVHHFLIEALRADGHECVEGYHLSELEVKNRLHDIGGIVIRSRLRLDKSLLEHCKKLKFIARAGAGMESIDVDYASENGIACLNAPEGNSDAVGEHATGMLLSMMNNLNKSDRQVREGVWEREANRGHELGTKTVGIIGYGNMGSAFAARLAGFGCTVLAYDKYKKNFGDKLVKEATLTDLYEHADVLSLHVPLTAETEYMINDDFIGRFRKKIIIVNTARGKCLRLDDLVKNLESGKVTGACLDVLEYEDLSFERFDVSNFADEPAWKYLVRSDRVVLTPHIAGWTYESHEKISKVLYAKIKNLGIS
jgi:D-3-phosphoglycerate dehydrogenase